MTRTSAYIIGPLRAPGTSFAPSSGSTIVAVDEGLDRAREVGLVPDIVVGDFDSVSPAGLTWLEGHESDVEIHHVEAYKDFSDLDLAFRICLQHGITHAVLHGFIGGRLDHQLVVLGVCARYAAHMKVELQDAWHSITMLVEGKNLSIKSETTFSVIALNDTACVSIEGARYPLDHQDLEPFSDLGLSNVSQDGCRVFVHEGIAAVILNHRI